LNYHEDDAASHIALNITHHCCLFSLFLCFALLYLHPIRRLVYQSAPVGMSTCTTTNLSSSSDPQVLPWTVNAGDDHHEGMIVDLEYLANGHTDVPFRIEVWLRHSSQKDNDNNDNGNDSDSHNDGEHDHDGFLIGAVETTLKGLLAARCSNSNNNNINMKGGGCGSVVDTILSSFSQTKNNTNTTTGTTIPGADENEQWKTKSLEVLTSTHGKTSSKPCGHIVILDASTSTAMPLR
jgi:hypothetical protein